MQMTDACKIKFYGDPNKSWVGPYRLTYDNQMQFIRAVEKSCSLKDKIYFDDIDCVDADTSHDIPGVKCNGKMTWGEALDKIITYFELA